MTSDERLKSEAVQLFIDRRYDDALKEFKILEKQYPKDIFIKRYIAACITPAPTSKKWGIYGQQGVEWQKNPAYTTDDPDFSRNRPESAAIFYTSILGHYEFFRRNSWTIHGTYRHYESFYSDDQDERNFGTNNLFFTISHDRLVKKRPFLTQFTTTFNHALRHGVPHSKGLTQALTLTYSPKDSHRIILYNRWGPYWYEDDGEAPEHTSRDAKTNVLGLANYFFFNKEKNFFTLLRIEYGHDEADGVNEDRDRLTYSAVLHFPIFLGKKFTFFRRTEGEVEFQFSDINYPRWDYPYDEPRRRDAEYTFRFTLAKQLNNHWTLRTYYTYLVDDSRNDRYTFTNHTIGSAISFYY